MRPVSRQPALAVGNVQMIITEVPGNDPVIPDAMQLSVGHVDIDVDVTGSSVILIRDMHGLVDIADPMTQRFQREHFVGIQLSFSLSRVTCCGPNA